MGARLRIDEARGDQQAEIIPEFAFSDRLRLIRRGVARQSQQVFAESLGAEQGAYSTWETGRNVPRDKVEIAKRIEQVTGVPAWWTLGLREPSATERPFRVNRCCIGTAGRAHRTLGRRSCRWRPSVTAGPRLAAPLAT